MKNKITPQIAFNLSQNYIIFGRKNILLTNILKTTSKKLCLKIKKIKISIVNEVK